MPLTRDQEKQEAKLSLGQPTVLPKIVASHDLGHAHFREIYLCACSAFPLQSGLPNSKSLSQVVLEICSIVCQKLQGHMIQATPNFRENYLCARQAFLIQSCVPNLKSLAPLVSEILRSKRIGVTSSTFQGHVTSWSRDHSIAHMPFPIGIPLEPKLYL